MKPFEDWDVIDGGDIGAIAAMTCRDPDAALWRAGMAAAGLDAQRAAVAAARAGAVVLPPGTRPTRGLVPADLCRAVALALLGHDDNLGRAVLREVIRLREAPRKMEPDTLKKRAARAWAMAVHLSR